jgi:hypothetical protein
MNHETMLQSRRRPRRSSTPVTIQKERLCGTPGNATTKVLFGLFPSGPGRECGPTHGGHSVWEEFHPKIFLSVNTPSLEKPDTGPNPNFPLTLALWTLGAEHRARALGKKIPAATRARGRRRAVEAPRAAAAERVRKEGRRRQRLRRPLPYSDLRRPRQRIPARFRAGRRRRRRGLLP